MMILQKKKLASPGGGKKINTPYQILKVSLGEGGKRESFGRKSLGELERIRDGPEGGFFLTGAC